MKILFRLILIFLIIASGNVLSSEPIEGFVDLHSHLMGEHAFGGSWYAGKVNGPIEHAVRRCDGNFPGGSHGATRWPILSEFIAPDGYDTGWHLGKRRGFDERQCDYINILGWQITVPGTCPREHFEKWPHAKAIAHQQMWKGWLKQAYNGGMKVLVATLSESKLLCTSTPPNRRLYNCDEMASVIRQANFINAFAESNSDWVAIARTPEEARLIEAQDKLVLVLSVEVTELFPEGDFVQQLDVLHNLGVRSIQLATHANNRFTGAAPLPKTVGAANLIEGLLFQNITAIDNFDCSGSSVSPTHCAPNPMGLTTDGVALVQAMMDRGMILDVAHMSRVAFQEIYQLAMDNGTYPLMNSHMHLWSTIENEQDGHTHHEKYMKDSEFAMIKNTNGMIGLRTGAEHTINYKAPYPSEIQIFPWLSISCQGSAMSFAQSLMYAVDNDLTVGFGADFNGFIEQAASCFATSNNTDLREKGLAHVGLLPAFIEDMQDSGVANEYIQHLDNSAENFVQLWERSVDLASIEFEDPADVTLPGTPLGFSITNYHNGNNILNWNAVSGAAQYQLHYSTSYNGNYYHSTTVNAPTTAWSTFVASNLYFKVRACNSAGCGGFSSPRLAKPEGNSNCDIVLNENRNNDSLQPSNELIPIDDCPMQ